MTLLQEIRQDIVANCDALLHLLRNTPLTNDTAEGRMIYQCRWLKEQAAAGTLPLPLDHNIDTLKYVSRDQLLMPFASSPERYVAEVGIHVYRLIYLVAGRAIVKPAYYDHAVRCIDALIDVLKKASRPLNTFEQGSIDELMQLKQGLIARTFEPPLVYYLPAYPNLREVYQGYESSVDDLPKGKLLMDTVNDLLFEGIRPPTWTTPQAAEAATAKL